ncbi:hypothetical protein [Okeania sp. SIO2B3]|uniref:plasmid mobilization protein n=1 Tax=Okeania sp. SIO2B3 TaxID=2607784 RepID=UPI0013BFE6AC|nr:hypothetical protein [Okeania sp. SIO2B3]NET45875.1 hypothetical protein [Okeania sp. SIO2B3]
MEISAAKKTKDSILSIRIYAEDKEAIAKLAAGYQISVSDFIIRTAFNKPLPTSPVTNTKVKEVIEALIVESYKIRASVKELSSESTKYNLLSELENLIQKLNKLGCYLYGES